MAAIEQQIPNMLGGVSQQPDPVKLPGQVRLADNVLLDPTFGCMKRPPTQWVGNLDTDLPDNVRWFPIFRDNQERYMVAIYRDGSDLLQVKVWDAETSLARTVVIDPDWQAYAGDQDPSAFESLSIADYTLICNTRAITSVDGVEPEAVPNDALVIVGQVAYNTSYNVDLGGPGTDPVVTTRATKLSISPSSWEDLDETCQFDSAENFQEDDDNGPGVGLNFRVTTQGTAFKDYDHDNDYDCRYTTRVTLQNGGTGWQKGDKIDVTMQGKTYTIKVEDVEELTTYGDLGIATFTTPVDSAAGGLSLDSVTNGIVNSIEEITGFSAEAVGNVIRVYRADNTEFTINVRGGLSDMALDVIVSSASDVSKLPSQCFDGYFLRIVNTEDAEADDYYVRFKSDVQDQPGPGSWEETVDHNDEEYPSPNSMPFALVREADGTFTLGPLSEASALEGWAGRTVGDSKTNPSPSFIGRPIYGMFLHRNRLGFLTEESVVMSQPGDFFNFYATSGVAISDADPIDLSASDTKPVVLRKALATPQGVMLFGEQAQFRLHSEENTFGPNTAELKKIATYDYESLADPQLTNVSIMFSSSIGEFTKVYELATDSLKGDAPVFSENTRTVPRYVPTDIRWSSACTNNDLVVFGDGNDVYAFRYFNQGNERQVAGWAKWTFDGSIDFMAANGDDIYVVETLGNQTNLGKMTLVDGPLSPIDVGFSQFRPRVDMQISSADLAVGADVIQPSGRVVTPYTLPAGYRGDQTFTAQAAFTDVRTGEYDSLAIAGDTFYVDAGRSFIFGRKYESELQLPAFYVKTDNRADRINNVMLQRVYFDLYNSGAIVLQIDVQGYSPRIITLPLIEADSYAASSVVVDENYTADVDIYQRGDQTSITLKSPTPFPTSVTSYSWTGQYNKRGYQRI